MWIMHGHGDGGLMVQDSVTSKRSVKTPCKETVALSQIEQTHVLVLNRSWRRCVVSRLPIARTVPQPWRIAIVAVHWCHNQRTPTILREVQTGKRNPLLPEASR